jgi:hypothetical protein
VRCDNHVAWWQLSLVLGATFLNISSDDPAPTKIIVKPQGPDVVKVIMSADFSGTHVHTCAALTVGKGRTCTGVN